MKLVFLGAPGAGKGTQAGGVAEALKIPHISTGDMFRAALGNETPVGLKAKAYMDKGELVPDSVTIEMVDERLKQADCENGYLLDGFPRTIAQAEALDQIMAPDCVVNLDVPEEILMGRLTGRRVCGSCKGTFAISRLSDPTTCPTCGGELIHRKDDQPETIKERLQVYHQDTEPLIGYYQNQNKLLNVPSVGDPQDVNNAILTALEGKA
ncbi:adenylate kinase [Eubacteriales bacterium OttesenSCG-928-N13]|nr:adenylate kinase [Eubacteriales bacterium OttesenSCG-928-N13]